jgi:hypothetical protein
MLIARLAHEHAPAHEVIDLINVCFDAPGHASPDRLASLAGVLELRRACPGRQWQLICVDESLASATAASQHVAALLAPKHSHMDWNIGVALWFASRGVGWVELVRGADGVDSLGSPRGRPSRHLRYGDVAGAALPDGRHSLSAFDGPAAAAQRTTVLGGGVSSPHSGPAATVSAGDVALALSGGLREGLAGVVGSEPPQAHAAPQECARHLRRAGQQRIAEMAGGGAEQRRREAEERQGRLDARPHRLLHGSRRSTGRESHPTDSATRR